MLVIIYTKSQTPSFQIYVKFCYFKLISRYLENLVSVKCKYKWAYNLHFKQSKLTWQNYIFEISPIFRTYANLCPKRFFKLYPAFSVFLNISNFLLVWADYFSHFTQHLRHFFQSDRLSFADISGEDWRLFQKWVPSVPN